MDVLEKHHWKDSKKCRLFFDGLAQAKGKNPLELDTWRSIDPKEIQACKVTHTYSVLGFFFANLTIVYRKVR